MLVAAVRPGILVLALGSEIDCVVCGVQEVRTLGRAGNNQFETTILVVVYGRHRRSVSTTLPEAGSI